MTTEPTPETAPSQRAGLRDQLRRAACEAEGFAWDSDMLEPDEYGDHADAALAVLYREWPWLRAEAEGVVPPADRAALRDRIADALVGWAYRGKAPEDSGILETVRANAYSRADAVLAVLPAADRATTLQEAAVAVAADTEHIRHGSATDYAERHAALLRRLAGEAQQDGLQAWQEEWDRRPNGADVSDLVEIAAVPARAARQDPTPDSPQRGDQFEQWLKKQRDKYDRTDQHEESSEFWHEFDAAVDLYRLHADTGTPLDGHVCEARTVGDCDCLETPAPDPQPVSAEFLEALANVKAREDDGPEADDPTWCSERPQPTSTALRIRVLRETLHRLINPHGDDSATEDVGAAQVRAVFREMAAEMEHAASVGRPDTDREA